MASSSPSSSSPVPEPLLKVLLYGGAPFFGWPFKPALNAVAGEKYERAYAHFRRDHQDPFNLFFHCLCLVFQLGFNYGLLSEVGKAVAKLTGSGEKVADLVPMATTAAWSWTLLRARNAPLVVRIASVAALGLAHSLRNSIPEWWRELSWATGVVEMMAVQVFVINKGDTSGRGRPPFNLRQLLGLVAVRSALRLGAERCAAGSLASARARLVVNALLATWMAKVVQDPFAAKSGGKATKTPFVLGLVGWLLAVATEQPWLYFYSGGFLASMTQGVAHHYAGEESTLTQLASLPDELAHTTFFPNLLFHSVYQSLTSGKGPAPCS